MFGGEDQDVGAGWRGRWCGLESRGGAIFEGAVKLVLPLSSERHFYSLHNL